MMNVQMDEIAYFPKENAFDKQIGVVCYLEVLQLTDTLPGSLESAQPFTHLRSYPVAPDFDYAIFDNICAYDPNYELMRTNQDFHLARKTRDGKMWAEIYKRN